ncbi:Alpha Beta hydrolase fold containing [Olea europaea subsp. europaea]|uniref:Alpha Beta hydrolase fold containing n=1 Tax=Olea europaea subsp. europaea TaxID=158383 RepID=A0A8S0PB95_OLEEU|nr:Alpha Beta hydrolase fold containing [Olea europaea subsp. europaea]
MIRWWISALQFTELFVTSVVHLTYGFYIFSTALAGDLSQAVSDSFFKPNLENGLKGDDSKTRTSVDDLPPIVLVHGIFGFGKGRLGSLSYFAGAEKKDDRVLVPDLGSLTSIYDRARELFYYLKGGQVDYGEEHSKACGHSQFGRIYEKGHYPEWDEDHPIHFVGHSAGAQVVRVLQQMLADKAFEGYENTSENWVLSITSLSGAFNGTTRTYLDGMHPEDGRSLKPICLLQLCRIGVIIYDWFDIPWLKNFYNFGFDHFNMSWKKMGIWGLIDCLLGNSGPFASGDWILPDLTIQGSLRLNSNIRTFPDTYYFSYATKRTRKIMGTTVPSGIFGIHPLLFIRVLQMSQWRHPPDVMPPYKGYRDEDWWDNDGALNTISMSHPRIPIEHPSHFVVQDSECQPLLPGIWYYKIVEGDHILFIVNRERAGTQFDLIYDSIFERCRKHAFRKNPTLPNHEDLMQALSRTTQKHRWRSLLLRVVSMLHSRLSAKSVIIFLFPEFYFSKIDAMKSWWLMIFCSLCDDLGALIIEQMCNSTHSYQNSIESIVDPNPFIHFKISTLRDFVCDDFALRHPLPFPPVIKPAVPFPLRQPSSATVVTALILTSHISDSDSDSTSSAPPRRQMPTPTSRDGKRRSQIPESKRRSPKFFSSLIFFCYFNLCKLNEYTVGQRCCEIAAASKLSFDVATSDRACKVACTMCCYNGVIAQWHHSVTR